MNWFAALTVLWLLVAALAWKAHQRGSARVARRWTTRLYAVTLVPVTALAVGGGLVAVQLAFAQTGGEEAVSAATPYAQWLALAINVVIVDIVIRRSDLVGGHGARQTSDRNVATSTGWPLPPAPRAPLPRPAPTKEVHAAFTSRSASSTRA